MTFQLVDGVSIYGGFLGTEDTREQRNWLTNLTVLSGDLEKDDLASPAQKWDQVKGSNAYHVTYGKQVSATTVLDGFIVTAGWADAQVGGYWELAGGGMLLEEASPTLRNLVFSGNFAGGGGGIYSIYGSAPDIQFVVFSGNYGSLGGGMGCDINSSIELRDVTFINNFGRNAGGGLFVQLCTARVTNVTFSGNSTNANGGGVYNGGSTEVVNATFFGNTATCSSSCKGGGIFNHSHDSSMHLLNVTVVDNVADQGGGIANDNQNMVIQNSIVYSNLPDQIADTTYHVATVSYSNIQGGFTGTGNIDADPLLGMPGSYGGFTPTIPVLAGSPSIDTVPLEKCVSLDGVTALTSDQRGMMRPFGPACDMGAFEAQIFTHFLYLPTVGR